MIDWNSAVRMGEMRVIKGDGSLTTLGVGSCIVIALCDAEARVGGLAHPLLPEPPASGGGNRPGRYVITAPAALLERMIAAGADADRTSVWLAGGASMFPQLVAEGLEAIGERNVAAARKALAEVGLRVSGEDVGGNHGRNITLDMARHHLRIRSATGDRREL